MVGARNRNRTRARARARPLKTFHTSKSCCHTWYFIAPKQCAHCGTSVALWDQSDAVTKHHAAAFINRGSRHSSGSGVTWGCKRYGHHGSQFQKSARRRAHTGSPINRIRQHVPGWKGSTHPGRIVDFHGAHPSNATKAWSAITIGSWLAQNDHESAGITLCTPAADVDPLLLSRADHVLLARRGSADRTRGLSRWHELPHYTVRFVQQEHLTITA